MTGSILADAGVQQKVFAFLTDPVTHPERAYNLGDSIALRNALRCT